MLAFWLIAGGMTIAALAFVLARLVVPRHRSPHVDPREANLAALRAARAELERDLAAGILPAAQFETAREELASRAAEELDEGPAAGTTRPAWVAAAVASVSIPLAAFAFYGAVGNPDAVESAQAFASLEGPLTAEQLPAYRDQLARHVASRPADGRAWALLARLELALDRFAESEAAFAMAVRDRKVALDPAIWCDYADAAGLAQGGRLEGRPAQLVAQALSLDPAHPRALEMAGSLAWERGDYAGAAARWERLLPLIAEGDAARAELEAAIARAQRRAARGSVPAG